MAGQSVEQIINSINRLMEKGMPRTDPTIQTLEGLIAEEMAKPPQRDDEFLQPGSQPEIGRPTYKQDPNARPYTEEDRENDRRLDLRAMDMGDRDVMMQQFKANPNPEGYPAVRKRGGGISAYTGQPNSPDLPSDKDIGELDAHPSDGMIQDFMDQFGLERLEHPRGRPEGSIPMPRPRYPDMEEGVPGPMPRDMVPGDIPGDLRAGDFRRRMRDPMTTEEELDYLYTAMSPEELDDVPKRGEYDDEDDRIYPRIP